MPRLSKETKGRAIGMLETGSSQRHVARVLRCNEITVRRLWSIYRQTGK